MWQCFHWLPGLDRGWQPTSPVGHQKLDILHNVLAFAVSPPERILCHLVSTEKNDSNNRDPLLLESACDYLFTLSSSIKPNAAKLNALAYTSLRLVCPGTPRLRCNYSQSGLDAALLFAQARVMGFLYLVLAP